MKSSLIRLARPAALAALLLIETGGYAAGENPALNAAVPAGPEALFQLGTAALQRDDTETARGYLEKAAAAAPNVAKYQHALGDAYGRTAQKASLFSQLGWAKKCLALYRHAVELEPENVRFHQSLFDYYLHAPGFAGGGQEKAVAEATLIKKLDPPTGRFAFAQLYVADKKFDLALNEFDEVLRTNPDDYVALYHIGRLAATTGKYLDRGTWSLQRCLQLTPAPGEPSHAAAEWRLGNVLERKQDVAGARLAYEAALKLEPKFAAASDSLKRLR